jgi:hypothetical protein
MPLRRPAKPPPPLLKTGKRVQPTWSRPNEQTEETPTATRAEPRQQSAPSFGPMAQAQGKKLMSPSAWVNFHPFAGTLREWEDGVPVDCGKPWTWEAITAAVEKGAHKSATSDESIALIAEDVAYQVAAGYAQIVTWEELCAA